MKYTLNFFRIALGILMLSGAAYAAPVLAYVSPGSPTGYVNDFAGVLSEPAKTALEEELVQFEASTSNEITVVTVNDLGGDYIENYAVKLFEEWQIGKKDKDNGVLLLLAMKDKTLRIEVGYGLEGALPDSVASSIITGLIIPLLKQGNYDSAVTDGVHAVMQATQGEYAGTGSLKKGIDSDTIFGIFIFAVVALQWIVAVLARSKSFWAGGVIGALAGAVLSTFVGWWIFWGLALTVGLFLFGLMLDAGVSGAYREAKSAGVHPPWWAGGT